MCWHQYRIPLGYQQFTVKLVNGLTRICAYHQIANIDNYFSENGPSDEWMDIILASLLPEDRPLSRVADWNAMTNYVTDREPVGVLPWDEDWHAIDTAFSEPFVMCPNLETPTTAPRPVYTASKSVSSARQAPSTNVTLHPVPVVPAFFCYPGTNYQQESINS